MSTADQTVGSSFGVPFTEESQLASTLTISKNTVRRSND